MMRKPFLSTLVLAAMLGCLVSAALVQGTATQAAAAGAAGIAAAGEGDLAAGSRGRSLVRLCGKFDKDGNPTKETKRLSSPCQKYIEANFGPKSDLIISTVNAVDAQKDRARAEAAHNKHWDRWLSGALIVLAFLTTVSAAVARTYRSEQHYSVRLRNVLGLIPIVVSALVTLGATFNAYYKFDETRAKNTLVADELAKLQTDIDFRLIALASEPLESGATFTRIEMETINQWQATLDRVMSNYTPQKKVVATQKGGGT